MTHKEIQQKISKSTNGELVLIVNEILSWKKGEDHDFIKVVNEQLNIDFQNLPKSLRFLLDNYIMNEVAERFVENHIVNERG